MRAPVGLLALAAGATAFLLLASPVIAGTPIAGTSVQVLPLSPVSKTLTIGQTTNFTWGVFNGGSATYSLSISASVSDPTFSLEVFPANLSLAQDELQEVTVNVTAPAGGDGRATSVRVTFETTAPVSSNLTLEVVANVRQVSAPVGVLAAFLTIGAIIAIGFAASAVFEKTRVPDILILIFLGLLLGPIASTFLGIQFVPTGVLDVATPYFTALALMFILFDGGLNLRLGDVVRKLGLVALQTGLNFVLTVLAVASITTIFLGYTLPVGLLLGAIVGGTSSAVVIGIARVLRVSEETKILLTLESVLTDVLCVVTALSMIDLLRGGPGASAQVVAVGLAQAFLIALAIGAAVGIAWLVLLGRFEKRPFSYMLTIALLLVIYAATEAVGGSGAMASFVFGLILGNHESIGKRVRIGTRFVVDERIKQFHSELSFVIRTFFFVFLGLVFTLDLSGRWQVNTSLPIASGLNGSFALFLIGVLLVFLVIVGVRILTARIVVAIRPKPPAERRILWAVMGRGLAAAVLASLAFTIPAFVSPSTPGDAYYRSVMAPYEAQFLNIAFFIILLSVGTTTVGVYVSERALAKASAAAPIVPAPRPQAHAPPSAPTTVSRPPPGNAEVQPPKGLRR